MPHKPSNKNPERHKQSIAVNAGIGTDPAYGAIAPPLYMSSTYRFSGFDQAGPFDYGRTSNPTRDTFGKALAALEGGFDSVITASGMAAIDLVLNLVPAAGTVLVPHDCYGGTNRLLLARAEQGHFDVEFIDQNDAAVLGTALAAKPDLIILETPSNPVLRLVDIRKITSLAKRAGVLSACDNTFLSPARQNPLALGADIVMHSCTKFINGHSDMIGGAVIARDEAVHEQLAWWANTTGVTASAFDCYQALRGLRTLFARMDVQENNAIAIAEFLTECDGVTAVMYPGLEGHPQYALANTQQSGPGALISFSIDPERDALERFFSDTGLFQLAESLGGTESLICHPATMTHRAMSDEAKAFAGFDNGLIRLSIGIEHVDDLFTSLQTMFANLRD